MKLLSTIILSALVAGCAGEAEMRAVSAHSAKMLTTYNTSLRNFAAGQSVLNSATEARIQRFDGRRLQNEAEISARVDTWRYLGDEGEAPLHRFEVIAANDANDLIAAATPQLPAAGLPALKFDTGAVGAVVKQLIELQKPVTLERRIAQLVTFGTEVLEPDLADATEDAASAEEVAASAEASAQTTAEKPPAG